MKQLLLILFLFMSTSSLFAQYMETFTGQTNQGIAGPCTNNTDPLSCNIANFGSVDWTLASSNFTAVNTTGKRMFVNDAGELIARSLTTEVCWVSPDIEIGLSTPPYTISFDYQARRFDAMDDVIRLDVYIDDVLTSTESVLIPGMDVNLPYTTLNLTETATGTIMRLEICLDMDNNESALVDNIQIPQILPIELLSFDALENDGIVYLNWKTATEENNEYMAVERSFDGSTFEEIGRVEGAGTTAFEQEYAFKDENPRPGLNYYRLRQVDFDGSMTYHRTVAVEVAEISGTIQIVPNPITQEGTLLFGTVLESPATLEILHTNGQRIRQVEIAPGTHAYPLDLSQLPAGSYYLQVIYSNKVESLPFIKQ